MIKVALKNWTWQAGWLFFLAYAAVGKTNSLPQKISLFNGEDLKGWKVPQGNDLQKWYQVSDRILKIQSGPKKRGPSYGLKRNLKTFILH